MLTAAEEMLTAAEMFGPTLKSCVLHVKFFFLDFRTVMILFSVLFILSGSSKVSLFCLGSCSFALAFFPAFSLHSIRPTQRAHDHRAQHMLAKSDK